MPSWSRRAASTPHCTRSSSRAGWSKHAVRTGSCSPPAASSGRRHSPRKIPGPRNAVPALVMDRPTLYPLVEQLLDAERLAEFAEALPTRARVSEPALPLVVAGLHQRPRPAPPPPPPPHGGG